MLEISGIDEVNMFKADSKIIHFERPKCRIDGEGRAAVGGQSKRPSELTRLLFPGVTQRRRQWMS